MHLIIDRSETHGLAAADDDVEPPVGKALEHGQVARQAPDLAHAGVVLEDDAERLGPCQAARHELAVAWLEDVQRQQFAGQEDERQREHGEVGEPRHPRQPIRVAQAII